MTRSVVDLCRQENSEPIVQRFEHVPSDAELASFVDPRIGTVHQKVVETDDGFRVVPGTLPLWFPALCSLMPAGGFVFWWIDRGRPSPMTDASTGFVLFVFPTIVVAMLCVLHFFNKVSLSHGDLLIVDKRKRTISLPTYGVELFGGAIEEVIEVTGRYTDATRGTIIGQKEASLLLKRHGVWWRFPLKADLVTSRSVRRRVRKLGDDLGVRYRILDAKAKGSYEERHVLPNVRFENMAEEFSRDA